MEMQTHKINAWMIVSALGFVAFTAMSTAELGLRADVISDCTGKVYGSPGCPTFASSNSSVAATCGNTVVDEGEECDEGRFNGQGPCGKDCRENYCGDGTLSPILMEECEPASELYYVEGLDDKLTTERRYTDPPACGSYCMAPQCDDDGKCQGGCKWFFRDACSQASSAQSSKPAAAATTTSASSSAQSSSAKTGSSASSAGPALPKPVASLTCGDGIIQSPEQCDDANGINIDACTNQCRFPACGDAVVQQGEDCDDGNDKNEDSCSNICRKAQCGDGISQDGEECDDGNAVNTDGCTNVCKKPFCGDSVVQPGEECDDGNRITTDSCTNICKLPACGDAAAQPGEECDDGNQNNTDMCSNTCKKAQCGDGIRQPGEECDDGNDGNADACTVTCRYPVCGNGAVEGNEQCDDGNSTNLDSCNNDCKKTRCGDGIVQMGEECDSGTANSDTKANICRSNCKNPACGDHVKDMGEECDGGVECNNRCVLKSNTSSARAAVHPGAGSGPLLTRTRVLIGVFSGTLAVMVATIVAFRKQVFSLAGSKKKRGRAAVDDEDTPLSELEELHKW